jgi:hypothetical protein
MSEQVIRTMEELQAVLKDITFAPSCVDMGWNWEIEELPKGLGWLVNTTFQRPDTETGKMGTGRGRQELINIGASVSGVVKTAWLLADLIVRHELMEAFLYRGNRVFDPHKSVDELCVVAECRKG